MSDNIIPFYNPSAKILVKSKDCYQYDSEGKEYIDFESGVWCANAGHSPGRITALLSEQVKESLHHGYRFRNHFAEKLSGELQGLIGYKDGSSVFLSSGSEAVNLSITLARHLTGREKILKIDNSYLSAFGFGRISVDNKDAVAIRFNDLQSVPEIDFGEIAAFVLETGGASVDMVRFPDKAFIDRIIHEARKNDCLVIANEVTTGMGRLGKWFGYQYYDVQPDMVVTGKGLGNGYPVSGVTITPELTDRFRENPFRYAQSHQNDPLGCAIGLEVIKYIKEESLVERGLKAGEYFKSKLEKLKIKYPAKVKDIRARGLMLALEFKNSYRNEYLGDRLFESGFIVGFKLNTLRFLPPLTIKEEDINRLTDKLDEILSENSGE